MVQRRAHVRERPVTLARVGGFLLNCVLVLFGLVMLAPFFWVLASRRRHTR